MKTIKFSGHECCLLENGTLKIVATSSVGPRILSFGFRDGENLFAELPDVVAQLPEGGVYHFYGGHRLWHAPEQLPRTYVPDDSPVDISERKDGFIVTQKTELQTSLQKSMEIHLTGDSQVVITHSITNQGLWDVTCAPWAITQLKPGGTAILPQTQSDAGLLPNRSLALWSYTDMSNPNVKWGRNFIQIHAGMSSPFKIGFPNPRGWLAYWRNGIVFVKRAKYDAQAEYYDFGCSSECYCNDQFLELETLAPISVIAPKASVSHVETWDLYKDMDLPSDEKEMLSLAGKLKLE
jgi:hypothetical protein